MSTTKTTNTNIVVTPLKNDIKSGAGVHSHSGNKYYLKLIKDNKKPFVLALRDTKKKGLIVREVYNTINKLKPPGRFLQKNRDGTFTIKNEQYALAKIRKALGENSAQIEAYFRNRGLLQDVPLPPPQRLPQPRRKKPTGTKYEPISVTTRTRSRSEAAQVTPEPTSGSKRITSSDWRNLFHKIGDINEAEIKQIKRQRLRGLIRASIEQKKEEERKEKLERGTSKMDMLGAALASMSLLKGKKNRS